MRGARLGTTRLFGANSARVPVVHNLHLDERETCGRPTNQRAPAFVPFGHGHYSVLVGNLVYWHMRIGQAATIGHALASDIHQPIKRRAYSVNNRTVVQLALTASHPPGTGVRLFNDAAVLL